MVVEPDQQDDQFGREELPNPRQIVSGTERHLAPEEDRWRVTTQGIARGEFGSRAHVLKGVTVS